MWERARVSHLMNADLPESVTSACQFSGVSSRVAEAVATDARRQIRANMMCGAAVRRESSLEPGP